MMTLLLSVCILLLLAVTGTGYALWRARRVNDRLADGNLRVIRENLLFAQDNTRLRDENALLVHENLQLKEGKRISRSDYACGCDGSCGCTGVCGSWLACPICANPDPEVLVASASGSGIEGCDKCVGCAACLTGWCVLHGHDQAIEAEVEVVAGEGVQ